jgi:hypothetical protein
MSTGCQRATIRHDRLESIDPPYAPIAAGAALELLFPLMLEGLFECLLTMLEGRNEFNGRLMQQALANLPKLDRCVAVR